jgi:hypothetical protein
MALIRWLLLQIMKSVFGSVEDTDNHPCDTSLPYWFYKPLDYMEERG